MKILYCILVMLILSPVRVEAAAIEKQPESSYAEDAEQNVENTEGSAAEEISGYTKEDMNAATEDLLNGLNLNEIDGIVKDMLGGEALSFSDMVEKLVSGELKLDTELLVDMLKGIFVSELQNQKEIILQLILLVLISALLLNLSHLFENGQMSNVTFYMVYLMVFALLMRSFRGLLGQVEGVIGSASAFMKVLTPAYFLAITAANGGLSASAYYEIVLITITLVQWLFLKIGIPGIQMYVVFGIVNHLSQEEFLSKMADLIKTVIIWMTKTITAIIVGLQVVQRMVAPALDMVKRGLIGKTASAIPGIGNVLDSVTEMTVGCAILVRNCMGAVALVVLVFLGLGPVIQVGVTTLLYRLMAAVVQPVSEKRLIQALTVMADGCALLLRILITAEILFLLTVAIVASGGME